MSKARPLTVNKNTSKCTNAIIYCRVSSDRQRIEGSGLESQEHRCREYAQTKSYTVTKVFKDSFTGGGDFMRRPAMSDLLDFVDQNAHENFVVVFDDLSRFARDVNAHFLLRQAFDQRGIGIECPNFTFDDTPEGELIETMIAAQHQYHRKNNKRQNVQKQVARLESGLWPFPSKRGYRMINTEEYGKVLHLFNPDASILREALEGFSTGRFQTKVAACAFLVEKGFWKKQKPERYVDKFTLILEDPLYAGFIEYPVWDIDRRKGKHEALISPEVFEANQKRLKQGNKGKRPRIDVSEDFPLRGLMECPFSGKPLTGAFSTSRTGKRYPYYFCQDSKCECKRASTNSDQVHKEFDVLLKKQVIKPEILDVIDDVFEEVWQEEMGDLRTSEHKNNKSIKELESKLVRLVDSASSAKSDRMRSVYEKQAEECDREIESLKGKSIEGLDMSVPYRTALEKAAGLLKSPYKVWHSVDVHEKQKLFYFIFLERLPYSKKAGYRTDNLPSAARLFEEFVSTNSHDVEMAGVEPASELGCECESTVRRIFFGLK